VSLLFCVISLLLTIIVPAESRSKAGAKHRRSKVGAEHRRRPLWRRPLWRRRSGADAPARTTAPAATADPAAAADPDAAAPTVAPAAAAPDAAAAGNGMRISAQTIDFWSRRCIPAAYFLSVWCVYCLTLFDSYSISSTDGQVSEDDVLSSLPMYKGLCAHLGLTRDRARLPLLHRAHMVSDMSLSLRFDAQRARLQPRCRESGHWSRRQCHPHMRHKHEAAKDSLWTSSEPRWQGA